VKRLTLFARRIASGLLVAAAIVLAACGGSERSTSNTAPGNAAGKQVAGLPTGHLLYHRYLSDDQTQAQIYALAPGETNGHAITRPPAGSYDDLAVASPDGAGILFTRCSDQLGCRLWTAASDGSGARRLSPKCCSDENAGVYSPDGRRIVFGRAWGKVVDNQIRWSEVFTMTPDGKDRRRLTHESGKGWQADTGNPSWSPDGRRIVYSVTKSATAASHPGERAIYIMNADGSGQKRLTPWELGAGDFARFSPDGERIIFRARYGDGPGGDLYTMRPDGSDIKKLTHGEPGMLSAAYSPDGKYIAFAHEGPNGQMPDIWVMKPDGTGAVRLTHTPQWESLPTWGI
jgi:TolB protein